METVETLKVEIKKFSYQAIQTKIDLHGLSEELPTGLERILEFAEKTFVTLQNLPKRARNWRRWAVSLEKCQSRQQSSVRTL